MPLAFEPNVGQADAAVQFAAHSSREVLLLAKSTLTFTLSAPQKSDPSAQAKPTDGLGDSLGLNLVSKATGSTSTSRAQAPDPHQVREPEDARPPRLLALGPDTSKPAIVFISLLGASADAQTETGPVVMIEPSLG